MTEQISYHPLIGQPGFLVGARVCARDLLGDRFNYRYWDGVLGSNYWTNQRRYIDDI